MSKMSSIFVFFAGVAVGGIPAWLYAKEKYSRRAEDDINSVKEFYAKRDASVKNAHAAASVIGDKPGLAEYVQRVKSEGYTDYSSTVDGKDVPKADEAPYVISPDEFGEIKEYAKISLVYFADGVLADDNNEVVDDAEEIVGDALKHFGDYEEDSVFVRNDAKRCDYEILQDVRNYKDVLADMPPRLD